MKKLRLLFTEKCNRNCEECCNKGYDLEKLPKVTHFNYDEILITGGEPLLFLDELKGFIKAVRIISSAKIIIYTSLVNSWTAPFSNSGYFWKTNDSIFKIIKFVDGITLTLHSQQDSKNFADLLYIIEISSKSNNKNDAYNIFKTKSLRLNVFKGIELPENFPMALGLWKIKDNIEWVKNCPLPNDEEFLKI